MLVVGAPRARATTSDPTIPNVDVIFFSGSGIHGTGDFLFPWEKLVGRLWVSPPQGLNTWPASPIHQDITDMTITFPGRSITFGAFGVHDEGAWHADVSNDHHTITFTAPPGESLNAGDTFATTILFASAGADSVDFHGAWSTPVPEPSSLLLFGSGLLLLGTIGRKLLHT
jgi:hypothetical protein